MRLSGMLVAAGTLLGIFAAVATAAPSVSVRERKTISLEIRCLTADTENPPEGGAYSLELAPSRAASLGFRALWPDADPGVAVAIVAMSRPPQPGVAHTIRLEANVELPDGSRHRSMRDLAFDENTTALFEVARYDEKTLTLAIEAEAVQETVLSARPTAGAPVVFHVDVQWLEEGRAESLETNRLSTFVGEDVTYSFKLGEMGVAEALELKLTPLAIYDDVMQLRAEVTGSVPREGAPEVLSRSESWLVSRGESSALDVAEGEPKSGFRFVVTPRF